MNPTRHVLVPLAEGFEEIEAVAIVDVLRRAGLRVTVAGLAPGPVRGAHGLELGVDATLDAVDAAEVDALVLPGGMPGTAHLMEDERVLDLVRTVRGAGRPVAAICAAPRVLAAAGAIDGLPVTSHPSVRGMLGDAQERERARVVHAGRVVTSQGPGTAIEFALELVRAWVGPDRANELAEAMCVHRPEGSVEVAAAADPDVRAR